jgi:signal transduction histidine kinase
MNPIRLPTLVLRCAACAAALTAAIAAAAPAVRVGVYSNPPKVALAGAAGASGIYVQVLEHAAAREGWALQYVPGTFQEGLTRLERGEIELMVDVAKTPERAARFDFNAEPVLQSWNEVYARRDLRIRYLVDLRDRRLGVLAGSVQEAQFREAAASWGVRATLVPFPTFEDAFAAVGAKQVDAVIANPFVGSLPQHRVAETAIIFGSNSLHFASRKGSNAPLLAALDRHLLTLKADPSSAYAREFEALVRGQRPSVIPDWVYQAGLTAVLLLGVATAWAISARRAARRLRETESQQRSLAEERSVLLHKAATREQQLQEANEDLRNLSYALSHDLSAPLAAINGFVAVAREQAGDGLDSRARHLLERTAAAGQRMERMLRELSELLRYAGDPLSIEPCDVSALAGEAVEGLRSHQSGGAEVSIQPGLVARADPRLMRVVLENLLGNAWKFSAGVPLPAIDFGRRAEDRAFFVRDNGVGFPMEHAHKLFQPFSRLHRADEFPGTGMGLSIVQRIIARHGGRVWAESQPGQGTTFFFTLP